MNKTTELIKQIGETLANFSFVKINEEELEKELNRLMQNKNIETENEEIITTSKQNNPEEVSNNLKTTTNDIDDYVVNDQNKCCILI